MFFLSWVSSIALTDLRYPCQWSRRWAVENSLDSLSSCNTIMPKCADKLRVNVLSHVIRKHGDVSEHIAFVHLRARNIHTKQATSRCPVFRLIQEVDSTVWLHCAGRRKDGLWTVDQTLTFTWSSQCQSNDSSPSSTSPFKLYPHDVHTPFHGNHHIIHQWVWQPLFLIRTLACWIDFSPSFLCMHVCTEHSTVGFTVSSGCHDDFIRPRQFDSKHSRGCTRVCID